MPAGALDERNSALDGCPRQIRDERLLLPTIDFQATIGESRAQRGRVTLQRGVGDVARVLSTIRVAPAQPLAPRMALRIAARAQDFERTRNLHNSLVNFIAGGRFLFLREALRVQREVAPRNVSGPVFEGRPRLVRAQFDFSLVLRRFCAIKVVRAAKHLIVLRVAFALRGCGPLVVWGAQVTCSKRQRLTAAERRSWQAPIRPTPRACKGRFDRL